MRCFSDGLARWIALALALLAGSAKAFAANGPTPTTLKPATLAAFDHYVRLTDARNQRELRAGTNLLWIDELPEAERVSTYSALKRTDVKVRALETRENGAAIRCPHGMIHHWVGLAFIPDAKLKDVLEILEDYDRHLIYYAPDVQRSKLESRDGDHFRVFLRFRRHKIITVVLNTEHDVEYFHDSESRAHSRSSALRIAEVANAGKTDEREKRTDDDGGFLWRMETWWRMIESDGGVYVQSEVVSLTRDIPAALEWLIGPFVTSIPKESLTFTLDATRKTVEKSLQER